jgi:hypothetical protein
MAEEKPLFTEAEWDKEVPKVTRAMHEYLAGYCVPISKRNFRLLRRASL